MRVILLDDDPTFVDLAGRFLERRGVDVQTVDDWRQLPDQIEAFEPDVVAIDVNLPGTSGPSVAQLVRAVCDCPILFLSAAGAAELHQICLDVSGSDYLCKTDLRDGLMVKLEALAARCPR